MHRLRYYSGPIIKKPVKIMLRPIRIIRMTIPGQEKKHFTYSPFSFSRCRYAPISLRLTIATTTAATVKAKMTSQISSDEAISDIPIVNRFSISAITRLLIICSTMAQRILCSAATYPSTKPTTKA